MRWLAAIGVTFFAVPGLAVAQTDEIQVYDGGLAAPGIFNLTLHDNFTPKRLSTPAFPGAVVADKSFNGVPEFALGVTDWFEAGLYLPLYSRDKDTGWGLDGVKLRALFAGPQAGERRFVYGVNFELSYNARRWDTRRITSEIRPIIGLHVKPVDIIINPILDTSYDGLKNLKLAPRCASPATSPRDGRQRSRSTRTSAPCTRCSRALNRLTSSTGSSTTRGRPGTS